MVTDVRPCGYRGSDSRVLFGWSTSCARTRWRNATPTLSECLKHLAETGAKQDASDGFSFLRLADDGRTGRTDVEAEVARHYLNTWSEWIDFTRREPGNGRAGTRCLCDAEGKTRSESP